MLQHFQKWRLGVHLVEPLLLLVFKVQLESEERSNVAHLDYKSISVISFIDVTALFYTHDYLY